MGSPTSGTHGKPVVEGVNGANGANGQGFKS